jgi:hypothetical protein
MQDERRRLGRGGDGVQQEHEQQRKAKQMLNRVHVNPTTENPGGANCLRLYRAARA